MLKLKDASRFENFLMQKGPIAIKGPVRRKITETEVRIDATFHDISPHHKTVQKNAVSLSPKDSMIIHHYRIFMNEEFLGRYRERYDDGILVKQSYEGGIPGYDFSADGYHGRLRKNISLLYLPVSNRRRDDFPSIEFP